MRRRELIEEEVVESNAENNGADTVALMQLEVLLDIRDLLIPKQVRLEVKPLDMEKVNARESDFLRRGNRD